MSHPDREKVLAAMSPEDREQVERWEHLAALMIATMIEATGNKLTSEDVFNAIGNVIKVTMGMAKMPPEHAIEEFDGWAKYTREHLFASLMGPKQ